MTAVKPPKVSTTKSSIEEVRTSDILTNVSDTGVDVSMGEGDISKVASTTQQGTPIIVSIETPTSTFVSLPQYIIPLTSTTDSPTFQTIIDQPFTSIFSSQSTEPPNPNDESNKEEGGFGGTFEELVFDEEEQDFLDHMLISMKQFNILNKRLNYIIQSQADMGGGSSASTFEMDALIKACKARMTSRMSGMIRDFESRILEKVDHTDQTSELRINSFDSKYVGALKELTTIQKERRTLFVMDVKKVREDVNQKL